MLFSINREMWRAVVAVLAVYAAGALAEGGALDLSQDSFQSVIASGPTFVKFFAPWCGHCKRLAEPWAELASSYEGQPVNIAKVDCTIETALCSEHGIRGYPTLKLFHNGAVDVYSGARTISDFTKFVQDKTGNQEAVPAASEPAVATTQAPATAAVPEKGLYTATDDNFAKTIETGLSFVKFYAPWCGHCKTLAPVISEVAEAYENNKLIKIVKVDCTIHTLCNDHQIKGYPTLILFKEGKEVERYSGGRTFMAITEFLQRHISTVVAEEKVNIDNAHVSVEVVNGLKILTDITFNDGIANGYTLVKFYAPWCGHCKRLAPTWEELALAFAQHPTAAVAKVDCTLYRDTCTNHQIRGYPTLILFKDGKQLKPYSGGRDVQSLEAFLTSAAEGQHDEL